MIAHALGRANEAVEPPQSAGTLGVQKGRLFDDKSLTRQGQETDVGLAGKEEDGVVFRRCLEWRARAETVHLADRSRNRVRYFPRSAAQSEAGRAYRRGASANAWASGRTLSRGEGEKAYGG